MYKGDLRLNMYYTLILYTYTYTVLCNKVGFFILLLG